MYTELIVDFIQWLNEVFVGVRVTNLYATVDDDNLYLTVHNKYYPRSFAVVVWGVKKEFYEALVLPRIPNIPDAVYGHDKHERFYFILPELRDAGGVWLPAMKIVDHRFVGDCAPPSSRIEMEDSIRWAVATQD